MAIDIADAHFLRSITRIEDAPPPRPSVAFAGRSNVGKSSLMNALVRRKGLARTSSTPGRTQSIVYFEVAGRYYFIDLPGYGYAKVPREVQARWGPMVEGFFKKAKELRLVIVILDIRRDPGEQDLQLIQWLEAAGVPYFFALTKADQISRSRTGTRVQAIQRALGLADGSALLPFSARSGEGSRDLLGVILNALDAPTEAAEAGRPRARAGEGE